MITRRSFVKSCSLFVIASILCPHRLLGETPEKEQGKISFRWRVPQAHEETVEKALPVNVKKVPDNDPKGVFVWVFIGLILLPDLAEAIFGLVQGMENGGVKIDTRGGKFDINTDKSLPPGVIVIASEDGTDLYYERDELSNPAELVSALLKGR